MRHSRRPMGSCAEVCAQTSPMGTDTIANARPTAHELRCSRGGQNLLSPKVSRAFQEVTAAQGNAIRSALGATRLQVVSWQSLLYPMRIPGVRLRRSG
jgi:hypothetical protein